MLCHESLESQFRNQGREGREEEEEEGAFWAVKAGRCLCHFVYCTNTN